MSHVEGNLIPIATKEAPGAIGPYSQAIRCGDFIFISGQVALDPVSGTLVGSDVASQTEQAMKNLAAILRAQGYDLSRVVKTTVFLKNMGDFPVFNEAYARHFKPPYPARATIEVSRLPKDAIVEIEAVAFCPSHS